MTRFGNACLPLDLRGCAVFSLGHIFDLTDEGCQLAALSHLNPQELPAPHLFIIQSSVSRNDLLIKLIQIVDLLCFSSVSIDCHQSVPYVLLDEGLIWQVAYRCFHSID